MHTERSAILIRCTHDEAELIRRVAKKEHRTLSGFALNVILRYIARSDDESEVTQEANPLGKAS
jgi:uncharacterized protein (DUF1778 family)